MRSSHTSAVLRMAQKFSLVGQIKQVACLMSNQDNPARLLHMMRLSKQSSGLMHKAEFLRPGVGTRPSRYYDGIARVSCRAYNIAFSIGIFGSRVLLRQPPYLKDATQWM